MRFLVQRDYERRISVTDLNTVFDNSTDATYTVLQRIIDTEFEAIEEVKGHLLQRYDCSLIFTDTPNYSGSATYYGNSRVQYHETAFSAATVYTTGQRVSYSGSIYSSTAGSAAHAFNLAEWTFVCGDYQLFYGTLPAATFQYLYTYSLGNVVWNPYDNRTYTSRINTNTRPLTDTAAWTQNAVYLFTTFKPDNGTYWTLGDNRNAKLVQCLVDVVIYHGLSVITKRFEPEKRIFRYMGDGKQPDTSALGWLKSISDGKTNSTLPLLPPTVGELSLRWHNSEGDNNTNLTDTPKMTY